MAVVGDCRLFPVADRIRALAVLGLRQDASRGDVASAYRRLVRSHHPDTAGRTDEPVRVERFTAIVNAYRVLDRHPSPATGPSTPRTPRTTPVRVGRRAPLGSPPIVAGPTYFTPYT